MYGGGVLFTEREIQTARVTKLNEAPHPSKIPKLDTPTLPNTIQEYGNGSPTMTYRVIHIWRFSILNIAMSHIR